MSVLGRWLGRSVGAWFGAIDEGTGPAPAPDRGFVGFVQTRDGGVRRRIRRQLVEEPDPSVDEHNAGVLIAAGII